MWVRLAAAVLSLTVSRVAFAEGAGAREVQRAAEHFDEGSRAYQAKRFEQAASHFEAAFSAVPNARALRMAMRARDGASQPSRAATLAALALTRYADDSETTKVASELLAKHGPSLANVNVRCTAPCLLAVNDLALLAGIDAQHTVYVAPGAVKLHASFATGGEAESSLSAKAGGAADVELSPPAEAEEEGADEAVREEPSRARPPRRASDESSVEERAPEPGKARDDARGGGSWYESRALFFTSLALTAGVGGATIWSGIDTLQDPGKDAVRAACAGLGESCPEYQRGVAKQDRTNLLVGVTSGAGLVTLLIGSILTDFSPAADRSTGVAPSRPSFAVIPWVAPSGFGATLGRAF